MRLGGMGQGYGAGNETNNEQDALAHIDNVGIKVKFLSRCPAVLAQ
jgi:hypothetical protein